MYSVQKISYTIKKEEESFRKYKDYETLLNSYSQEENDAKGHTLTIWIEKSNMKKKN